MAARNRHRLAAPQGFHDARMSSSAYTACPASPLPFALFRFILLLAAACTLVEDLAGHQMVLAPRPKKPAVQSEHVQQTSLANAKEYRHATLE